MANKEYLNYRLTVLKNEIPALRKKASNVESALAGLVNEFDNFQVKVDSLGLVVDNYHLSTTRQNEKIVKRLQDQIHSLEAKLANKEENLSTKVNPVILQKATTIAIFDSILNAITSWSEEGNLASDIEAASQSILFPTIYERIMAGDDPSYILDEIPECATIIVARGREYVKWVRENCETDITHPDVWNIYAPQIQKWWLNDALPMIYGESDPDWEDDIPYALEQIETWRQNPADRMTAFPRIFDAMEIYKNNRKEIIETTEILNFLKQTAATRIPA